MKSCDCCLRKLRGRDRRGMLLHCSAAAAAAHEYISAQDSISRERARARGALIFNFKNHPKLFSRARVPNSRFYFFKIPARRGAFYKYARAHRSNIQAACADCRQCSGPSMPKRKFITRGSFFRSAPLIILYLMASLCNEVDSLLGASSSYIHDII